MSDIIAGSVGVQLVPNARGFDAKAKALLHGLTLDVGLNTNDVVAGVEKVRQETERKPVEVPVKAKNLDLMSARIKTEAAAIAKAAVVDLPLTADGEALRREILGQVTLIEGLAKIDIPVDLAEAAALRNKMAVELELLQFMADAAKPTVTVDADTAMAEARLNAVARPRTAKVTAEATGLGGLSAGTGSINGLIAGAALLGPALIPVTAAVGGLAAALSAPLIAGGGALTVFGILAGKAISDTNKQKKLIDDLAQKVNDAKAALEETNISIAGSAANSLSSAQASAAASVLAAKQALAAATTPAARLAAERRLAAARTALATRENGIAASGDLQRAAAQRKVTAAVAAYNAALAGLSPAQSRFLDAQDRLKRSFTTLVQDVGPALFGPVVKGLDVVTLLLPKFMPVIRSTSKALGSVFDDLSRAVQGDGFQGFIDFMAGFGSTAIRQGSKILGNIVVGFGGLAQAAAPLGRGLLKGLRGFTKDFADFGKGAKNNGFQDFLGYVKRVGPVVADFLGDLFRAIGGLAEVFAPLGDAVLIAADGVAEFIAEASPGKLAAIAVAIGGIAVAVGFATGGLSLIIPGLVAMVGGLIYAYKHSKRFQTIVREVGDFVTKYLIPPLKEFGGDVLKGIKGGFNNIKDAVEENKPFLRGLGKGLLAIGTILIQEVFPRLGRLAAWWLPKVGTAIGIMLTTLSNLSLGFLSMAEFGIRGFKNLTVAAFIAFNGILSAATAGLGWIPGIGGKIRGARKAFDDFGTDVIGQLDAVETGIRDTREAIDSLDGKTAKVHIQTIYDVFGLTAPKTPPPGIAAPRLLKDDDDKGKRKKSGRAAGLFAPQTPPTVRPERSTATALPRETSDSSKSDGGVVIHIGQIVSSDWADLVKQIQRRTRSVNGGGVSFG